LARTTLLSRLAGRSPAGVTVSVADDYVAVSVAITDVAIAIAIAAPTAIVISTTAHRHAPQGHTRKCKKGVPRLHLLTPIPHLGRLPDALFF